MFHRQDGVKRVYRFVAAVVLDGTVSVRVEKVKEVDINSRFMSLELCARTLDGTDLYYGLEVVKHLRGYCGIAEGYLSGEREFVDIDDIIGMAAKHSVMSSPRSQHIRSRPKISPLTSQENHKYKPYNPVSMTVPSPPAGIHRAEGRRKQMIGYPSFKDARNSNSSSFNVEVENKPAYVSRFHDREVFNQYEENYETRVPSVPSVCSSDGKWSSIGFASQKMYEFETGTPLCREKIEENLDQLTKSWKEIDFGEHLIMAQSYRQRSEPELEKLCLINAFHAGVLNKLLRNAKRDKVASNGIPNVNPNHGFSLQKALRNDDILELPSRKLFKLSEIVSSNDASKWTSSFFSAHLSNCLLTIYKKLADKDGGFHRYTGTDAGSVYISLNSKLRDSIDEFAIDGFGQERSDDVKSYVRHVSNRIVTNLCTRKRTSLKKSDVAASPEDDAAKLREDCQNGLENSWLFSPSSSGARVGVVYSDDSEDGGGGGFGSDDE
uniref:Uncharacterized protein n=1 Tax=Caenorhabditis japonica TaxID=281687 RepID=A0A8R1IGJ6_CAEJA